MKETQDTQVQCLGQEDPLEKEIATHSNILTWKIPWTEEPGGLQYMRLQRAGHDWAHTSVKNMLISKKIGNYWRFRTGVTAWTLCFKLIQKGLECEGRWALGSIATNKASGGDGIPAELFQILKDDAIKVLHSICQQIWKARQATELEKVSFHSKAKEGQC